MSMFFSFPISNTSLASGMIQQLWMILPSKRTNHMGSNKDYSWYFFVPSSAKLSLPLALLRNIPGLSVNYVIPNQLTSKRQILRNTCPRSCRAPAVPVGVRCHFCSRGSKELICQQLAIKHLSDKGGIHCFCRDAAGIGGNFQRKGGL